MLRALRLPFKLLGGMKQTTAFLDDDAARARELRPTPAAIEQRDVEIAFALLYEICQCGRHAVHQLRRQKTYRCGRSRPVHRVLRKTAS
ncbi:hypothetical protein A8F11_10765 [Burkholderia cenocepacia]|nr:hypothetical protein [Burkholderia cenocepacia]MCW3541318.1 hypothetical protein [Burkholderia cenocepacia]ONW82091.1 hypothetical protein A8F07_26000 [Burkholderia cenocepacia]ONX47889.1 hypothetical protein A8F11_10765 [Burkholderia cenocepacia]